MDQTGKKLQYKQEYQNIRYNHIRRNTLSQSVITEHKIRYNHEFRWNEVEILDSEKIFNKRLISDVAHQTTTDWFKFTDRYRKVRLCVFYIF